MASAVKSTAAKKSWKDDAASWVADARQDPAVAAAMDAATAARTAAEAARKARAEAVAKQCADFHVWRKATRYVTLNVQVSAGVAANCEGGWEVEPKYAMKQMPNRALCPCCGGSETEMPRQQTAW